MRYQLRYVRVWPAGFGVPTRRCRRREHYCTVRPPLPAGGGAVSSDRSRAAGPARAPGPASRPRQPGATISWVRARNSDTSRLAARKVAWPEGELSSISIDSASPSEGRMRTSPAPEVPSSPSVRRSAGEHPLHPSGAARAERGLHGVRVASVVTHLDLDGHGRVRRTDEVEDRRRADRRVVVEHVAAFRTLLSFGETTGKRPCDGGSPGSRMHHTGRATNGRLTRFGSVTNHPPRPGVRDCPGSTSLTPV